jgi:hypothetical protein
MGERRLLIGRAEATGALVHAGFSGDYTGTSIQGFSKRLVKGQ